eukprot:scaffold102456_cov38-Prasinocladus_malaysianus.AAC.1
MDYGAVLKSLNLEGNGLTECPSLVGLPNVVTINLASNALSMIPDSIVGLSQMTSLSLEKNNLAALPDVMGQCESLTYLDVSNNQLHWLPDSFAKLTQLKTLKVRTHAFALQPTRYRSGAVYYIGSDYDCAHCASDGAQQVYACAGHRLQHEATEGKQLPTLICLASTLFSCEILNTFINVSRQANIRWMHVKNGVLKGK